MTRTWLPLAAVGLAALFAGAPAAQAAIEVQDLDSGASADGIAQTLAGSGVSISNVDYTGADRAAGTFSGAADSIGFDDGIVLGSGKVRTGAGEENTCSRGVEGPNNCFEGAPPFPANCVPAACNSFDFDGSAGDEDLTDLSGFATQDAAIVEFDFVPASSVVQFNYVFSSEEYNDFANTQFNDVFAFFVNGTNCATVPGTGEPVSVNAINNGNPGGDMTPHNAELFRDNVRPASTIDTEMDGLTTVLACNVTVNAGQTNHMKLAIADASDGIVDSAVFLQAESLVPLPAGPPPGGDAPLGPPIPNQTVNTQAVEGTVLVKLPGETEFTPLEGKSQIPVGSQLDTTNGKVEIESASDFSGGTRIGQFYGGIFTVTQNDKGGGLITHMQLVPRVGCGKPKSSAGVHASGKKGSGNGMWGSEKGGGHSTGGKKGSGSARGTIWFVGDRCDGTTLAKVTEGKVKFRDFERKKTVTLKAGDRYVAG
jgi:hypothetical protein